MKRTAMKRSAPMKRSATRIRPRKAKKRVTHADLDYMGRVAALGCMLCQFLGLGATPAIVHHKRTGTGMMRASHRDTIPLCPPHHQHSGIGVHDMGRLQFEEKYGISELGLLAMTRQQLGETNE